MGFFSEPNQKLNERDSNNEICLWIPWRHPQNPRGLLRHDLQNSRLTHVQSKRWPSTDHKRGIVSGNWSTHVEYECSFYTQKRWVFYRSIRISQVNCQNSDIKIDFWIACDGLDRKDRIRCLKVTRIWFWCTRKVSKEDTKSSSSNALEASFQRMSRLLKDRLPWFGMQQNFENEVCFKKIKKSKFLF